jgi:hypothetical protein
VTLEPTVESMKRLAPAPEPVAVPAAPAALTLDATLAGWQDVPFLHLSATQSVSRNFKLAWSKEGLFGAVLVEQAGLHPDVGLPGAGDGLEVDLKTDPARHAPPTLVRAGQVRLYLAPRSDSAPGPATVQPSSARGLKEPLRTACRKTATGYTLVFLIPAKDLSPNPLAAGQILSLDLILRHDGLIVEQFTDTSAYRSLGTPPPYGPQVYWGQIRLSGQ